MSTLRKFFGMVVILCVGGIASLQYGVIAARKNSIASRISQYEVEVRSVETMIADLENYAASFAQFDWRLLDAHIDIATLQARKKTLMAAIDFLQSRLDKQQSSKTIS